MCGPLPCRSRFKEVVESKDSAGPERPFLKRIGKPAGKSELVRFCFYLLFQTHLTVPLHNEPTEKVSPRDEEADKGGRGIL